VSPGSLGTACRPGLARCPGRDRRAPAAVRRAPAAVVAWALLAALSLALPRPAAGAARPAYGGELRVALPHPARVDDPALAERPSDLALVEAIHAAPLTVRPDGSLGPSLLSEVPTASPDGRSYHLVLREGLRDWDGAPLGAADLAQALARLLQPQPASPHAWAAVAIEGAEEVLAGRAQLPAGLVVRSERELLVTLAFPFPEFPHALATPPVALRSAQGAGAGPFRPAGPPGPAGSPGLPPAAWQARLEANLHAWRGRPLADALRLSAPEPRAAARALQAGELDLSLRPDSAPAGAATARPTVTYARLSPARLGPAAEVVRQGLAALDRGELARRFQRVPAEPLAALLPPPLLPAQPLPPARPVARAGPPAAGTRVVLLVPAWSASARTLAERIQVRLFDAGLRPVLEVAEAAAFAARLTARDYDLALVQVTLLSTSAPLAAGQVAGAVAGPAAALRAERALAGLEGAALQAAASALRGELELVPLVAAPGRAAPSEALRGLLLRPDGGFDAGDLWRLPGAER